MQNRSKKITVNSLVLRLCVFIMEKNLIFFRSVAPFYIKAYEILHL